MDTSSSPVSKIHLAYVPFTGFGSYNGYRGDAWLTNRLRVFKSFVLPSLMNQDEQRFIVWFSWRPEDRKNPLVLDFKKFLNSVRGLSYVFTFHGPCIYDDKYPDEKARERLYKSLSQTLPELAPVVGEAEWVYLTIQPSDDLYSSEAFKTIQEQEPEEKKAVGWKKGYVMDYTTKNIALYDPDTTPPFTTFVFPKQTFLDPQAHFDYIGPYESHEFVPDHFNYQELPGRAYCVGTHGSNISTVWEHPYKGPELQSPEREATWLRFGVWDSDPTPMPKGFTLKLRSVVNRLPKPLHDLIRNIYRNVRSR